MKKNQTGTNWMLKLKYIYFKIVFLPEACDYLETSKEASMLKAEPIDGPLINKYRQLALDNKIWLSLGGVHRKVKDRTRGIFNHFKN